MMNERKLRYIMEIAKEGNITTAAQNLFISQPSLSNFLLSVEEELGAKLFDRSVSPMILTYAGEKYIAAAEKIIGTLQELQHQIDDMNDTLTGRLHIGCGTQQSPFLIPAILPILMDRFPGIQFRLFENSWDVLEEHLLNGTLDLILYGRRVTHPNIEYIGLSEDEMVLLAPPSFQPKHTKRKDGRIFPCVELHALGSIPFVLMNRVHQLRAFQDRIFQEYHYEPNVILETDNWLTCLLMVESGIAFTILPNAKIDLDTGRVGKYSFEHEHTRQTILCYRKNSYFPKILQAFINVACEALRRE